MMGRLRFLIGAACSNHQPRFRLLFQVLVGRCWGRSGPLEWFWGAGGARFFFRPAYNHSFHMASCPVRGGV